jgi:DNA processing protein
MDLQTAVAASMLPASRAAVAAAFKQVRHDTGIGVSFLELLWAAVGRSGGLESAVAERLMDAAARAIADGRERGIEPIAVFDERYPPLLSCIVDPPPVLWMRGQFDVLTAAPTVALIGSRAASPYALEVGYRVASELAGQGIVVSSGLARGVDSAAHRGCLEAGGRTVAVQGCGLDRVYPMEHEELAAQIAKSGLLLAELAPGAAPLPEHFPLRNRIISGISLATVVVEASEHSGSLITARCALEQGRDVMAVPGSVLSGRNRGSHALLKDGAKVVETAEDILDELGWPSAARPKASAKVLMTEPLLLHMDPGEAYGLDDLVDRMGMDGARLLARLTELELAGLVSAAGGRYVRRS